MGNTEGSDESLAGYCRTEVWQVLAFFFLLHINKWVVGSDHCMKVLGETIFGITFPPNVLPMKGTVYASLSISVITSINRLSKCFQKPFLHTCLTP